MVVTPPALAVAVPVSRSRDRLIDAVVELLSERSAVSVTDVVERAGVTRPTFYNAFGDVATACEAAARSRLDRAFAPEAPVDTGEMVDALARVLTALREDAAFFSHVLSGPAGTRVLGIAIDYVASRIRSASPVSRSLAAGPLPLPDTSRALAAGVVWWMLAALDETPPPSAGRLAARLRDFLVRSVDGGLGDAVAAA
jgi:AcrR family transcriptional regulator